MTDSLLERLEALRTAAPAVAVNAAIAASGLVDGYVTRPSTLGTLFIAFTEAGVSAVDLATSPEDFEQRFVESHGREAVAVRRAPGRIERHLDRAIATGRPGPLPIDLGGLTDFQQQVLLKATEIPAGEVRPYGWVAKEIGRPGAVRAVGSALARNPVPLVIPCHRVVRSDGRLGDYSLGEPSNKGRLLEAEGLDTERLARDAARGVRFVGSDTTHIYCHPTCRDAKRITERHRVEFRNAAAATEAGYRACRRCRPAVAA